MIRSLYFFFRIIGAKGITQLTILSTGQMIASILQFLPMLLVLPMIRLVVSPDSGKSLGRAGQIIPESAKSIIENFLQSTPYQDILVVLVIAAITAQIFQGFMTAVINNVADLFLSRKQVALARSLFRNFLTYDYGRFKSGNPVELIENGCLGLTLVSRGLSIALSNAFTFGIASIVLIYFFPIASIFGISSFLILTIFSRFILAPYLKKFGAEQEKALLQARNKLTDRFEALKELKILGREKHLSERFIEKTQKDADRERALTIANNLLTTILSSLHYGSLLVGFFAAIWYEYPPERISAFLFVYIIVMIRVSASVNIMLQQFIIIKTQELSLENSYALMKELLNLDLDQDNQKMSFTENIRLENISFRYHGKNNQENILENFNFTVNKGEFIALVGKNGSGKTTVIDLLSAYHIPDKGRLLADGIEVTFNNAQNWQKNIGYVIQKSHIIDDSILANITIGVKEEQFDLERLAHIIEVTKLDEVIAGLSDGINTQVGPKGKKLSGGQAQRLSIARALYSNSQILLLDEATKSIDAATEKQIMENITRYWKDKSIVMITHRLETLRQADKIYLLDRGRIVAEGNFDELSKNSELFCQLLGKNSRISSPSPAPL